MYKKSYMMDWLLYRVVLEYVLFDIISKSNFIKILNGFCVLIKDGG